jgi:hypothetical protein
MHKYTGKKERGYCFLCGQPHMLAEVVSASSRKHPSELSVGWECPHCGGVSVQPHQTPPPSGPDQAEYDRLH